MPSVEFISVSKYDMFGFSCEKRLLQTMATPKWLLSHCKMVWDVLNELSSIYHSLKSTAISKAGESVFKWTNYPSPRMIVLRNPSIPCLYSIPLLPRRSRLLEEGSVTSPAWISNVVPSHPLIHTDPWGIGRKWWRRDRGGDGGKHNYNHIATYLLIFAMCQALSEFYL